MEHESSEAPADSAWAQRRAHFAHERAQAKLAQLPRCATLPQMSEALALASEALESPHGWAAKTQRALRDATAAWTLEAFQQLSEALQGRGTVAAPLRRCRQVLQLTEAVKEAFQPTWEMLQLLGSGERVLRGGSYEAEEQRLLARRQLREALQRRQGAGNESPRFRDALRAVEELGHLGVERFSADRVGVERYPTRMVLRYFRVRW